MAKEYVGFKEVVELFGTRIIYELNSESKTPRVNIIFPEDAFKLFEYVKSHPFTKEDYLVPDISDNDLKELNTEKQNDSNCPTIYIKNPVKFFELLVEFTNSYLDFIEKYRKSDDGRAFLIHKLQNILIRMSPSDFNDIELFLQKQIDFIKAKEFDELVFWGDYLKCCPRYGAYENLQILVCKELGKTYCESSEKICFSLYDKEEPNENIQTLPDVYYGIREEAGQKVCYIYAIQNPEDRIDNKRIQKKLYRLNKGIENPVVHPMQLLALKTFIDMLNGIGITNIKVPCRQVLSHRYHEILSYHAKKTMKKWTPEVVEHLKRYEHSIENKVKLNEYNYDRIWASHVVDREDEIEKAKTEGLYNIFYRVAEQFDTIEILNDPFIEDEYLNIRIKSVKKLSKSCQ